MEEGPHFSAQYLHLCACGVTFTCTFIGRGIGLGLGSAVILEKLPSGLASWGFSWPAAWKSLSSDPDLSGFRCLLTHVLPCPTPTPSETHAHFVSRHWSFQCMSAVNCVLCIGHAAVRGEMQARRRRESRT